MLTQHQGVSPCASAPYPSVDPRRWRARAAGWFLYRLDRECAGSRLLFALGLSNGPRLLAGASPSLAARGFLSFADAHSPLGTALEARTAKPAEHGMPFPRNGGGPRAQERTLFTMGAIFSPFRPKASTLQASNPRTETSRERQKRKQDRYRNLAATAAQANGLPPITLWDKPHSEDRLPEEVRGGLNRLRDLLRQRLELWFDWSIGKRFRPAQLPRELHRCCMLSDTEVGRVLAIEFHVDQGLPVIPAFVELLSLVIGEAEKKLTEDQGAKAHQDAGLLQSDDPRWDERWTLAETLDAATPPLAHRLNQSAPQPAGKNETEHGRQLRLTQEAAVAAGLPPIDHFTWRRNRCETLPDPVREQLKRLRRLQLELLQLRLGLRNDRVIARMNLPWKLCCSAQLSESEAGTIMALEHYAGIGGPAPAAFTVALAAMVGTLQSKVADAIANKNGGVA